MTYPGQASTTRDLPRRREEHREKLRFFSRKKFLVISCLRGKKKQTTEGEVEIFFYGLQVLKISKNNFANNTVQDSIFFYAIKYTFNLHIFQFNDLTLVQLRNAGGYSLIKTNNVADSIALYEPNNDDIKIQEKFYTDSYVQIWAIFKQIFDGTLSGRFCHSYESINKIRSDIYVLISKDEEKIGLLYNNY